MADDVAITAGSGTTIGADERTINSTAVKVQRVVAEGGTAIAADDISVTTSAPLVCAARETRKSITVLASPANTEAIYVGASNVDGATPANGFRLDPGAAITIPTTAAVYADAISATQTCYFIESYDS